MHSGLNFAERNVAAVFAGVFLFSFLVQFGIWFTGAGYIDDTMWMDDALKFSRGVFPEFGSPTPVHPGTGLLLPAAVLLLLPLNPWITFHLALAGLMALGITASSYTAFLLRPKSLWWVGVAVLLAPNAIFPHATAPSALASVFAVLFVLLMLLAKELRGNATVLACLGACAGFMASVRIDISAFLSVLSLAYLWPVPGNRIWVAVAMAAAYFAALDPYLYIDFAEHIRGIYGQIDQNRQVMATFGYTPWVAFLPSVSVVAALVYAYLRPQHTSLPKEYLVWLLAMTGILCSLLAVSDYHPMRYFLPLMCIWEVFLFLFALEYASQEPLFRKLKIRTEYLVLAFFALNRISRAAIIFAAAFESFDWQEFVLETAAYVMNATLL
jgi:hypothetical protein